MWAIRILNGPQVGQVFPLSAGRNVLGRGGDSDIKLNSTALSREHASIYITDDKVIISDLNSRNGTFVNGVKIQNQKLNLGDKIMFQDLLLDIIQLPDHLAPHVRRNQPLMPTGAGSVAPPPPAWMGNNAIALNSPYPQQPDPNYGQPYNPQASTHQAPEMAYAPSSAYGQSSVHQAQEMAKAYVDQVAMPGIYSVAQSMSYFQFIAFMLLGFIALTTALSIIPMISSTKSSIMIESKRRAMTIARNMAVQNRQAILDKNELGLTIRMAELEEGVTAAMLISAEDGTVIAPVVERGRMARDGFAARARREQKEFSETGSSIIKVAVPIVFYNERINSQGIAAYAVVHYDTSAIALNSIDGMVLFVKTFAISLFLGIILFYVLMRLIEQPFRQLNADLDEALRVGRDDLKPRFQMAVLESLANNINTLLGRALSAASTGPADIGIVFNRDVEAANVVRMIQGPAIAINAIDNRIIAANEGFNQLAAGGQDLAGRSIRDVPDPALQENLNELLPRMKDRIGDIALSEIPFFGEKFEICGQTVMGTAEPAWYLVTLNKVEPEG